MSRREQLVEKGRNLLGASRNLLEKAEPRIGSKDEFMVFATIVGLYAIGDKMFRAIHILCDHGDWEAGRVLLRTLIEALASIKYVRKENSTVRAMEYSAFHAIQDMKMITQIERNSYFRDMALDELKEIAQVNFDNAKAKFSGGDFARLRGQSTWHGKTVENFMQEVGLQPAYDAVYRVTSQNIHATDAKNHVSISKEKGIVINFEPREDWIEGLLEISNGFYFAILRELNEIGNLGGDELLTKAKHDLSLQA